MGGHGGHMADQSAGSQTGSTAAPTKVEDPTTDALFRRIGRKSSRRSVPGEIYDGLLTPISAVLEHVHKALVDGRGTYGGESGGGGDVYGVGAREEHLERR
jgi:hypothetical protein